MNNESFDRRPVVLTAPERIWLQVSDDFDDDRKPFPQMADRYDGVTWCQDPVVACEVAYVRADIAARKKAEDKAEVDRLKAQLAELERDSSVSNWPRCLICAKRTHWGSSPRCGQRDSAAYRRIVSDDFGCTLWEREE